MFRSFFGIALALAAFACSYDAMAYEVGENVDVKFVCTSKEAAAGIVAAYDKGGEDGASEAASSAIDNGACLFSPMAITTPVQEVSEPIHTKSGAVFQLIRVGDKFWGMAKTDES